LTPPFAGLRVSPFFLSLSGDEYTYAISSAETEVKKNIGLQVSPQFPPVDKANSFFAADNGG
jgi:hypothetical protein